MVAQQSHTAIIESATAIGLARLPAGEFHPFTLDTSGLAALIRAAARSGATRCCIGIGGSSHRTTADLASRAPSAGNF